MKGLAYDLILNPIELAGLRNIRAKLLSQAHGKTLEIGLGTGLNLPYYPKDVQVIGIEPDGSMRRKALKRAQHFHAIVKEGNAMALSFGDQEFDTVVGTLVFCTIPDPAKAIKEVYRVMKPGGKFLLLEHVRRNTPLAGKLLDVLTPLWKHIADGCHLNRDPSKLLEEAGFEIKEFTPLWKGLGKYWVLIKPPNPGEVCLKKELLP